MIREYEATDCADVVNVWARATAVAHSFLPQAFLERERRDIANVHLPNADTWVSEFDGRVVGFISLLGNEVGAIFVDPQFHRLGIGRALIEQARVLRGELEVEVFEKNHLGRAFYAKIGFRPIGRTVHGQTGFEIMRLRLPAGSPVDRDL